MFGCVAAMAFKFSNFSSGMLFFYKYIVIFSNFSCERPSTRSLACGKSILFCHNLNSNSSKVLSFLISSAKTEVSYSNVQLLYNKFRSNILSFGSSDIDLITETYSSSFDFVHFKSNFSFSKLGYVVSSFPTLMIPSSPMDGLAPKLISKSIRYFKSLILMKIYY